MNDNDVASDSNAQAIFGAFLKDLIAIQGCTLEEAFRIVQGEIKREYDRRVFLGRVGLRVVAD